MKGEDSYKLVEEVAQEIEQSQRKQNLQINMEVELFESIDEKIHKAVSNKTNEEGSRSCIIREGLQNCKLAKRSINLNQSSSRGFLKKRNFKNINEIMSNEKNCRGGKEIRGGVQIGVGRRSQSLSNQENIFTKGSHKSLNPKSSKDTKNKKPEKSNSQIKKTRKSSFSNFANSKHRKFQINLQSSRESLRQQNIIKSREKPHQANSPKDIIEINGKKSQKSQKDPKAPKAPKVPKVPKAQKAQKVQKAQLE